MPTTYTQAWQPPASTYTPSPSYTHVESTASSGSGNQIIQNQRPTPIASTPTTRVTPAKEPARVQVTKVGYYGSTAFNRTESVNEARVYLKNVGSSPAQCFVNGTYSYPSGNGGLASSGDTSSVRLVQGQEQFVRFGMASRNIANFQYTYRCQPI